MTICASFFVAVIKIVFCAPSFVIDSIFKVCLRCFFSVAFVGSGMPHDNLPAKSSVRSSTLSLQFIDVRSVVANLNVDDPAEEGSRPFTASDVGTETG